MKLAKTFMIQGTASSVGKSTLVTGLCRIFAQEGYRVAPFKAQNMSLNAAVTHTGGEIGRAQATQAEAAGIEPTVEMNPILLKPESHSRSQVIVMGRPLAAMEAREYYHHRTGFLKIVHDALNTLRQEYDLVMIEGAGSPVELNLAHYDLVNMRVAQIADAPVLLVGDIDQGGIFASMLGTLMLLQPEERLRVKGLIVNKFRGDLSLWQSGEQLLATRSGVPVLGTIPFLNHLQIAEEDSVALEKGTAMVLHPQHTEAAQLHVVLVRLPYLSNYDESVLGICGGYQMLGERVSDPSGAETDAGTVERGLGLLPLETVFASLRDKVTRRCQVQIAPLARRGLFAGMGEYSFHVYQIHLGRTTALDRTPLRGTEAFYVETGERDGWLSPDGWCAGSYLHGLFENTAFQHTIREALLQRKSERSLLPEHPLFSRQSEYDRLADVLRQHLNLRQMKELCHLVG